MGLEEFATKGGFWFPYRILQEGIYPAVIVGVSYTWGSMGKFTEIYIMIIDGLIESSDVVLYSW